MPANSYVIVNLVLTELEHSPLALLVMDNVHRDCMLQVFLCTSVLNNLRSSDEIALFDFQ